MKTKSLLLSILLIFLVKASFSQCANVANIYTFTYNGHTYEVVKEMKNWTTAAACAVERGGYLVQIDDQAEQNQIFSQITTAGISSTYTQVVDGGGTAYVWIGATDKFTEGTWKWDGTNSNSGTNFWNGQGAAGTGGGSAVSNAFVNWGGKSTGTINEPDNYFYQTDQDAAAIALTEWPYGAPQIYWYGIASEWNDIAISNTIYYIIEKNSGTQPCQSPTSPGSFNVTATTAKISWTSTAPNFSIRYKPVAATTWQTTSSTNDTASLSSLIKNTTYHFQVKANCSSTPSDTSAWTSLANFTTLNDVGISQETTDFNIYPNPVKSNGTIRIEFAPNEFNSLKITDLSGKTIKEVKIVGQTEIELNISGIPGGIYFITMENKRLNTISKKIVVE